MTVKMIFLFYPQSTTSESFATENWLYGGKDRSTISDF